MDRDDNREEVLITSRKFLVKLANSGYDDTRWEVMKSAIVKYFSAEEEMLKETMHSSNW